MDRQVWNRALEEHRQRHARGEKYASDADLCRWLTAPRGAPATAWLGDAPVHCQQQVLKQLDLACKRDFDKKGGFPTFKRYGDEPGLRFPDPKQFELDPGNARIRLPKLGGLRLRQSQAVTGALRNLTVRREGTKWFGSIQTRTTDILAALDVEPTLGIDLNVTVFAATSDGEMIAPLQALRKQQWRLKHAQRAVSRKVKGSSKRKQAIQRLGEIHRRIAHQRSDWLHKLTTDLADLADLANRQAVIAIEDLKVENMSASAKGTVQAPGKNVRQKAGLNRGILDAAWGEFARQLTCKLEWRGGQVVLVNPADTSRTCRLCHFESADNRKTHSVFPCVACRHTENADVHAAKNILAAGCAVWLRERTPSAPSTDACAGVVRRAAPARARRAAASKQEPAEAQVLA